MASLRARLIWLLGAAILAAAILQFFTSVQTSAHEADKLFDYHMQQMAFALQDRSFRHARLQNAPNADDNGFEFVIQIWTDDGVEVYQPRTHSMLPGKAPDGYSTVTLANGEWRIYAEHSQNRLIQISQKMQARHDRAMKIAWRSVWPIIPVSLLLFAVAWWVITSALSPLRRIGRDLANRNADSLAPLTETHLPREVALVVGELNSLLARMTQALLSQQQFVADAAHELRSPVTALSLQLQTLARSKDETARAQGIERLRGGIDRASRLIEQLLMLARQDPMSQTGAMTSVSLENCLTLAVNDMKPFALAKNIEIRQGTLTDVTIEGDEEGLRVLLRNLIDNAIRYTPEAGLVLIDLSVEQARPVVRIQDSGVGISQGNRPRIFDRFYRVPGTRTGGTGLGLAIVKAIADRHQASVELHNAALGGLEVCIRFPASHTAHTATFLRFKKNR